MFWEIFTPTQLTIIFALVNTFFGYKGRDAGWIMRIGLAWLPAYVTYLVTRGNLLAVGFVIGSFFLGLAIGSMMKQGQKTLPAHPRIQDTAKDNSSADREDSSEEPYNYLDDPHYWEEKRREEEEKEREAEEREYEEARERDIQRKQEEMDEYYQLMEQWKKEDEERRQQDWEE